MDKLANTAFGGVLGIFSDDEGDNGVCSYLVKIAIDPELTFLPHNCFYSYVPVGIDCLLSGICCIRDHPAKQGPPNSASNR